MAAQDSTDCIVIGYNESPFDQYVELIAKYGRDSEAFRDLQYSFVDVGGEKLTYVELLNRGLREAGKLGEGEGMTPDLCSGEIPNLAAAYLTNYLRRRGHAARYVNLFQEEKDELARLLEGDPLCVAITTTFYVVNFPVYEMVEFIRRVNPKVKIVVGGPLIANHARNYEGEELEAALRDLGADIYVIESQGESALLQIVEALKQGKALTGIPNLALFEDGKMSRTPAIPEFSSLDENFIDWRDLADQGLGPTLQTRTARSCAFSCSFCNYPTRAGKLNLANLDTIEKELDSMAELGARQVVFIDDTFNVPLPRFKDICRMLIRKSYGFEWFSYFRCSNSDEETVELMAESGCKGVFLGIESGSPTILANMNKHATVEKYVDGIRMLKAANILTFSSFIIGFPGETAQTVQETIDFIEETRGDYYRTQMWYCEPGTPIFDKKDEFGIEGSGFVWNHNTMDSLEAMDHIDRIFLSVDSSQWLPQWSFDFWIIPYLIGRGISTEQFGQFMREANRMLKLEVASLSPDMKAEKQREYLEAMTRSIETWHPTAAGSGVREVRA